VLLRPRLSALLALNVLAGCQDPQKLVPPPIVHTPLAIDPMEEYEVIGWWSNGHQLLRLDESGSFALFAEPNRYRRPREFGHWSRQSYAHLALEPYHAMRTVRHRASIERVDGRVALRVYDLDPFFAVQGPPVVMEDLILGSWLGTRHALELAGNGRYRLDVTQAFGTDMPAIVAGHEGAWELESDTLRLYPDPPNLGPFAFTLWHEGGAMELRGPDGPLVLTPTEEP